MPRKIHGLSDATKDTLTDNVKAMSNAWDCSPSFIYQVLREEKADPFPPFREMRQAALKAGISTEHWDSDLEFDSSRYLAKLPGKELAVCFNAQLQKQNRTIERYMEATQDGEFTLAEIDELENMLIAEMDAIRLSLRGLKLKREKLQETPSLRPVV